MDQFKRAQVVMLPTIKESILLLNPTTNKLVLTKEIASKIYPIEEYINLGFIAQHLYIISDDEIKKGDWVYHLKHSIVKNNNSMDNLNKHGYKKIIATTDPSLKFKYNELGNELKVDYFLPRPSQQFIEKYIEEYNKGNVIKDVLVEYDEIPYAGGIIDEDGETFSKLKVNPKNNSITIKKVQESWNREEVEKLLYKITNDFKQSSRISTYIKEKTTGWITENL